MATYEMTFYLSNFLGARTLVQEDEYGNEELGVFIPIERNGLILSSTNKYLTWGFVQEQDVPTGGFSHMIKQKTNPEHLRMLNEQGLQPPMIGRMKPTKFYHRKPKFINTRVKENELDI